MTPEKFSDRCIEAFENIGKYIGFDTVDSILSTIFTFNHDDVKEHLTNCVEWYEKEKSDDSTESYPTIMYDFHKGFRAYGVLKNSCMNYVTWHALSASKAFRDALLETCEEYDKYGRKQKLLTKD